MLDLVMITTLATPDGPFSLLVEDDAVLASGWTDQPERILQRLRPTHRPDRWVVVDPDAEPVRFATAAVRAYYNGELTAPGQVAVRPFGTAFQLAGWAHLRLIPAGQVLSYTGFAQALGRPNAVRAVAGICAANAAALFVPCHRIRRSDATLGGFAWGVEVKNSLLERELHPG